MSVYVLCDDSAVLKREECKIYFASGVQILICCKINFALLSIESEAAAAGTGFFDDSHEFSNAPVFSLKGVIAHNANVQKIPNPNITPIQIIMKLLLFG